MTVRKASRKRYASQPNKPKKKRREMKAITPLRCFGQALVDSANAIDDAYNLSSERGKSSKCKKAKHNRHKPKEQKNTLGLTDDDDITWADIKRLHPDPKIFVTGQMCHCGCSIVVSAEMRLKPFPPMRYSYDRFLHFFCGSCGIKYDADIIGKRMDSGPIIDPRTGLKTTQKSWLKLCDEIDKAFDEDKSWGPLEWQKGAQHGARKNPEKNPGKK